MRYKEFERIISAERMSRYVEACGGNTRKAMTLYRYNLQLSQEMFTIISCFEVALRNAINKELSSRLGAEWLKDSMMQRLFAWMGIDNRALLYGLDHVQQVCKAINELE